MRNYAYCERPGKLAEKPLEGKRLRCLAWRTAAVTLAVAGLTLTAAPVAPAAPAVATTAPAVAPLASATSTALAADCATDRIGPSLQGLNPGALSIGVTPVVLAWTPQVSDPCGIAGWAVYRWNMQGWVFKATNSRPAVTLPVPKRNAQAGWTDVWLSATDRSANRNVSAARLPVQLLRRTTFQRTSLQLVEGPAGSTVLQLRGQLTRANWQSKRYETYPWQKVFVQFKPTDSDQWQHVQTVGVDQSGWMQYRLPVGGLSSQRWVGQWRLRYLGSETGSATTSAAQAAGRGSWVPTVSCQQDRQAPSGVQVRLNGTQPPSLTLAQQPVAARFQVQAQDPCGTGAWQVGLAGIAPQEPNGFLATDTNPSVLINRPTTNLLAGYRDLSVWVRDGSPAGNATTFAAPIRLARATRFGPDSLRVQPPYSNHAAITILGKLERVNWYTGDYQPFAQQKVAVQKLDPATAKWRHVKFATTDANGWLRTQYWQQGNPTELFNGEWRLRYYPTERYGGSTSEVLPLVLR